MSRDKFLKLREATKDEAASTPPAETVTYARLARRGSGWEVLAVDLPETVIEQYGRIAAEYDLYPNQERKLLIEARKTDFEKWK